MDLLGWHWLVKPYRFQVYNSKYHLQTASCTHHPKSFIPICPLLPPPTFLTSLCFLKTQFRNPDWCSSMIIAEILNWNNRLLAATQKRITPDFMPLSPIYQSEKKGESQRFKGWSQRDGIQIQVAHTHINSLTIALNLWEGKDRH